MDKMENELLITSDFVQLWCKEYGLPLRIKLALTGAGLTTGGDLVTANNTVLEGLSLSNSERELLQNAREQYTKRRDIVDEIITEKLHANREAVLLHAKKVAKQAERQKCPSENDVMKERLRRRKDRRSMQDSVEGSNPNISLAERLMARRNMTHRSVSLPVCSNNSLGHKNGANRSTQSTPSHFVHYTPEEENIILELSRASFYKEIQGSTPPLSTRYVPKSGKMKKQSQDMTRTVDRLQKDLFSDDELKLLRQIEQENG